MENETQYRSDNLARITARIERTLYNKVRKYLHFGQQTPLFKKFYSSLEKKINEGKFNEVIDYIYKDKPITLD